MSKTDKIKEYAGKAQYYLELADKYQQMAFGEFADAQCYDLHNGIEEMMGEIDELLMEVCIPLEMNTLDLGDGRYDAREGNEDSFSNLDK